jgi:hypothetical protein
MTASEKRERRSHFRGKPRPGRRVEVEYRTQAGAAAPVKAHTRNIGIGGAFIVSDQPVKPGEGLTLTLFIPTATGQQVDVRAEVRWVSTAPDMTGFGVKFLGLAVEELLQLNEYFASLTGKEV